MEGPRLTYRIQYFDHPDDGPRADGGKVADMPGETLPTKVFFENRERLVTVESEMGNIEDKIDRALDGIEDLTETVEEVEDKKLSATRFEEDYKPEIAQNSKITTLAKWGGGLIIVILSLLSALLEAGML